MRIVILAPPHADVSQPPLGLPTLAAFLRAAAQPVIQRDIGVQAFEHFTAPARLSQSLAAVRSRLADFESRSALSYKAQSHYRRLARAELAGPYVIENIQAAKAVLRDPERFYQLSDYRWAIRLIQRALSLVSAEFYPTHLELSDYRMRFSWRSTQELREAIECAAENVFRRFFEETVVPQVCALSPDIVGLSIAHGPQMIPAFTLARLIKAARPETFVVFGGPLLPYLADRLSRRLEEFPFVDGIVVGEGEHALLGLARALEGGGSLDEVPNLTFRDRTSGQVRVSPRHYVEDLDSLPTPDFDGLPLSLYLAPSPVLPLAVTKDCAWARCAFCSRFARYRQRAVSRVVEDMRQLGERCGARHFVFSGDLVPARTLRNLAQSILNARLAVSWSTDVRAEKSFTAESCSSLAQAGARELRFGLESACQRVLDLIDKGVQVETMRTTLRKFHAAGIGVRVSLFVGFPSETRAEAEQTLRLMLDQEPWINFYDFTFFGLEIGSRVYQSPEAFGITRVYADPARDLDLFFRYEVTAGQTMQQALETFSEFQERLAKAFQDHGAFVPFRSHSLLLLSRYGPGLRFPDPCGQKGEQSIAEETVPRPVPGIHYHTFQFDLQKIERLIFQKDLEINDILLSTGEPALRIQDHLESQVPPLAPSPATYLFHGPRDRITRLGQGLAALVPLCDGTHTVKEIVGPATAPVASARRAGLNALAAAHAIELES